MTDCGIKVLLKKVESYGIHGNLLLWLHDYLKDRKQQVIMRDVRSSVGNLQAGVPQGSVLGPLLFLLFINDIADEINYLVRLYADDSSLMFSSKNRLEIERNVNSDLCTLDRWAKKWLVDFNPQKTEYTVFSFRNFEPLNLTFGGQNITMAECHKHLGVTFSNDCKWANHINTICEKASKQIFVLRKLKYILCRKNLNIIYLSFILPLFEYACELLDGCSLRDKEKLERLQLEAARIITGLPRFASKESLFF